MKIGIIGAGAVGAACAMATIMRGCASELVIVNRGRDRAKGMATDMGYEAPLSSTTKVTMATIQIWLALHSSWSRSVSTKKPAARRIAVIRWDAYASWTRMPRYDPGILRTRNFVWMLTSAHRRIRFMMLVIAFTAPTWSSCQAIGSFQTKPAFPSSVRADDPPPPPAIAWPNASASSFVGSCGRGRVGDPQTHRCRG